MGTLGRSDDESGLLITVFLLSAIVVRPFSGKLLDMYGKKRMLVSSIILYVACTVLYIFIKPFAILLALRFFQGIWFSIVTTATGSLAADIVPKNRTGAGIGYFMMSTNLAVVIGPFVGLLVIQYASFNALISILTVIVLLGAVIALTINTDDLPKPENVDRSFKFNDLFEKKALPMAFLASLIAFSYASVLSFLSLYAEQKDLLEAASYFYVVFAATMLITRPFTGKIYDTKGAKYVVLPSFVLFCAGLVMLAAANGAGLFLFSAIFIGIGYGTLTTSFQSLCVQSTTHQRSGYATSTYFTLFDLGIAIGSYILGLIAVGLSYEMVYYIAAAMLVVVFVIYSVLVMRKPRAQA